MKLEMKMTERDKKLLIFLSMFVVVVGIGYWVLLPIVKNIKETEQQIEDARFEKQENDIKISMLPMLESETEDLEKEIVTARADFYPMMTSDEVDKMLTGIALDYNLNAFDLDILMPDEESSLDAYQYAVDGEDSVEEDYESNDGSIDLLEDTEVSEDTFDSDSAEFEEDNSMTGIYCVKVSMRVGGDEAMLQKFIDDYSKSDKKILLTSYSWESVANSCYSEDMEEYDLIYEKSLNISFELFMCEN